MPLRPVAYQFTAYTSTSTGTLTGVAEFGTGMGSASVFHLVSGTTKNIAFKMQGSVSNSSIWADLMAATTGSTSGGQTASTAVATFDKVRIAVTANATTGNGSLDAWVLARP